jgi:peroxiredoxin Q/BCP
MNPNSRRIPVLALIVTLLALALMARAENPADFTVESPLDGSQFQLSKHRGKVVVLHFLLKTECPFCLKHTHDYATLAATTPDVVHVFLKPDSVAEIKAWAAKLSQDDLKELPRIYRDPDATLAKQFGIPDGYAFHGQTVHYPALVALDAKGKELFRYVGKSNSDRMKPKDFTAKLAALTTKR